MVKSYPPRPRCALTIGVTGHRPNRLPEDARADVKQSIVTALMAVRDEVFKAHARYAATFKSDEPILALSTALAEGADSIAAAAAISAGYKLDVVLPYPEQEYVKDFSAQGLSTFVELRQGARAALELNGTRTGEVEAYRAAGLVVLDMSDILIAVWDGKPAAGRGGTVELINEAARRGMPIIHIDAEGKSPTRILWRGLGDRHTIPVHLGDHPSAALADKLGVVVDTLLRLPLSESEQAAYHRYVRETTKRLSLRLEFPFLMGLLGVRWPHRSDFWLRQPSKLSSEPDVDGGTSAVLQNAYGWADAIAVHFAQVFRSAFVSNFLISALAIIAAVISLDPPWSVLEIALVFILVLNTMIGQKSHWHHRWIESREVAERLRVSLPMYAIGTRTFGPLGDTPTWTSWYVRAILREAGLRNGVLDVAGLQAARQLLCTLLSAQRNYHESIVDSFQRLHDRLASAGKYFFISALVVATAHFLVEVFHLAPITQDLNRWIVVLSVSLPALAAASYGIRVIGEFDGASRRSARMKSQLMILLTALEKSPSTYDTLRDVAHHASEVMLGDVANWRVVVESRELEMPG